MKKTLLFFVFIFSFGTMKAQIFSENFNSGSDLPTLGWTVVDNDGNTPAIGIFTDAWINYDLQDATYQYAALSTSYYNPSGTSDDWLISPAITLPTQPASLTWVSASFDSTYTDGYNLMVSTTGTAITDFTTVLYSISAESVTPTSHLVDLSAYAGQTIYLAWVNNTFDGTALMVDNIVIDSCVAPLNVTLAAVTSNAATINWDAMSGNQGFEYVLDINATDPTSGTATTATTYTDNSLLPETTYYFHIRNNCDATTNSIWTTISFTTLAVPPANDVCATALVATTLPYNYSQTDAVGSTNNDGFITTCTDGMNDGLWFTFTGDGGDITVTVSGVDATFDSQVGIFSGDCTALTCETTVDDTFEGEDETATITSVAGQTYFVNVAYWSMSADGAEGNFTIDITTSLATQNYVNGNFRAYPNPVIDILNISYYKNIKSVKVYNVLGQEMITKTFNAGSGQVDMSNFSKGNYLVKVFGEDEIKILKVTKQ